MPRKRKSPAATPPTTRIVEPETEHVHAPITRMDGQPAWQPAAPPPTSPDPSDSEQESPAAKSSRRKKSG